MELMDKLFEKASNNTKRIVLPEGEEERTIVAVAEVLKFSLALPILIGNEQVIKSKALELGVNIAGAMIIDPTVSEKNDIYANALFELRKSKGLTLDEAKKLICDNVYFGTMMVKLGEADGLVSGAIHTTANTIKPGLQIIKAAPGTKIVSSFFIMIVPNHNFGDNGVLLFADCGLNQNPNAEELASIAIDTAKTAETLCEMDPKVALLSFSTKGSAEHESIDKIRSAVDIIKELNPNLKVDGELQLDAAIIPEVASFKAPGSMVAGRANVLIFPDLNAGNIGYKLVERFARAQAIGPICQGFAKPINDLSRGCSSDDIVKAIVVTSLQASIN